MTVIPIVIGVIVKYLRVLVKALEDKEVKGQETIHTTALLRLA